MVALWDPVVALWDPVVALWDPCGGTVGPLWWHCGTPVVALRDPVVALWDPCGGTYTGVREVIDMRGCPCEKGCCVHVQETYMCRNHIRHFGVLNGRSPETLTLCGTYSFHRACTYVEVGEVCMLTSLCTVCAIALMIYRYVKL